MDFCILIELSKERISFLYNRSDSDNGFVPFEGQSSLPLAVYCSGNQMEIGQFAVEEANKQNPCAFTDVFRKLRDGGTFKYRGEEIPNNMLLFNAIQRHLSVFFDDTLIGQMGRLEQNIATMPICFLFNADINENERLFVKDSFVKSGFANVGIRDCDQLAMRTVHTDSTNYVCVTSNGQDLYVNIYNKRGKRLSGLLIPHLGRDPRMDVAVDKLWDSIGFANYYLDREREQTILEQVAENFLESGKYYLNECITFSNGDSHDVNLSLYELESYGVKGDEKIVEDIIRRLSDNKIMTSDCTVILQGKAAQNRFFSNIFRKEFNIVHCIDSSLRTEILTDFLQEVKNSGYRFVDKISKTPSSSDVKDSSHNTTYNPKPIVSPSPIPEIPKDKIPIPPTKRDERDMKILCQDVNTCIGNSKIEQALRFIKDFTIRMHAKNVHAFDEELQRMSERIVGIQKPNIPPIPPSKRDERDMKMLRMEIETCVRNGETYKIQPIVNVFRKRMYAKNVHAFDEELSSLEAQGKKGGNNTVTEKCRTKTSDASKESKTTLQPQSKECVESGNDGIELMHKEKYKEAREWFRANNQRTNADDCTTIIRWLRFLPAYEAELQSTIETKNRDKARERIKDIKEIVRLYNKYGLDVSRLTKLYEAYKRIR